MSRGNNFEDVAIGFAEKEPLKRSCPLRRDQLGSLLYQTFLEFVELTVRKTNRKMTAAWSRLPGRSMGGHPNVCVKNAAV